MVLTQLFNAQLCLLDILALIINLNFLICLLWTYLWSTKSTYCVPIRHFFCGSSFSVLLYCFSTFPCATSFHYCFVCMLLAVFFHLGNVQSVKNLFKQIKTLKIVQWLKCSSITFFHEL